MSTNFEYEEILSSLLSQNSASLLLSFLQDYMKDDSQEFELNIYDQSDFTVSRNLFQTFELHDLKKVNEEFVSDIVTMYTNPIERAVRMIADIDTNKPKDIVIKNILKHFTSINVEENLNTYGMLIKFKLNEEIPTKDTKNLIIKYQQIRQRKTIYYHNWKLDKSLRYNLHIPNKFNKEDFDEVNYEKLIKYTHLDIEIEHIGKHENIMKDFHELMNSLFPKKVILEDMIRSKYNFLTLPKVITLEKKRFEADIQNRLNDFVWLYKTDGERVILLVSNEIIYIYSNKIFKRIDKSASNDNTKLDNISIFDAEYYVDKEKETIFVFDSMIINNVDVTRSTFLERIEKAKKKLTSINNTSVDIIVKEYNTVDTEWIDFIEMINSSRTVNNIKVDGIILQNKYRPYAEAKDFAFKVKPQYLNTIDFLAMYAPIDNKYILFVTSSYKIANAELKKITFHSKYYRLFFNNLNPMQPNLTNANPMVQAIFSSPYAENASYLDFVNIEEKNLDPLFEEDRQEASSLINKMKENPYEFNHKVIECVYTKCWIPLRLREDKKYANKYVTAISNFDVIFNYFDRNRDEANNKYFSNDIKESEVSKFFKFINSNIRTYIYDKYVNPICDKTKDVCFCDLACGRGADIPRIVENCISNVFALDTDKDALVEYRERFSRKIQSSDNSKKITHMLETAIIPKPAHFTLNIINKTISEQTIYEIEQEIRSRSEFAYFDIVVCNFAIHYLLYNIADLISLVDLLLKVMKKNGILIMTYFNGDKIMDNIELYNSFKLFKITLLDKQENKPSKSKSKYKGGKKIEYANNLHTLEYNYINWLKKYKDDRFLLNTFCTFYAFMSDKSIYEIPLIIANGDNLLKNGKKYDKPENTEIKLSHKITSDFLIISDAQESLKIPNDLVKTLEKMYRGKDSDFISHLYVITKHYYYNPEYSIDAKVIKDYKEQFNTSIILDSFNFAVLYDKLDNTEFYSLYENDRLFGANYVNAKKMKLDSILSVTNNKFIISYLLKNTQDLIIFTELKFSNSGFDFINSINVPLENSLLGKKIEKTNLCIKSVNISFDKIWSPLYRFSNKNIEKHGMLRGGNSDKGNIPLVLMPLITIDESQYREEPIVLDQVLKTIFEPSFIEVYSEAPLQNIADEYISLYERRNVITDEEFNEVMSYCNLITVKVYKKNEE